jgi:glycosyltransferase involved in cell wall biosynthesis
MRSAAAMKIGYLCSEFPALSHTFISREISILEREGFEIPTVSINIPSHVDKMGARDRAYAARTYAIKGTPKIKIAALILKYIFECRRFAPTLLYALHITARSGPKNTRKAFGYFIEAVLLHSWAGGNQVRHIHVHFANPAATVALIAARLGGLTFSLSVHGPDEFYDVTVNCIREKIEAAVFVRCISYFCRSQLMRLSPIEHWGKFHIIRCGIFKDEFERARMREGSARNILCVGRLCPSKGQAILVEAAEILRRKGYQFRMLLLGGGEDLETIRNMIEKRNLDGLVEAAGPVGHERVKKELASSDLFVLPSFAEGIPVALMEAMASGVPVISTNIAGIPELIENRSEGILTQASNAEELARSIEEFITGTADVRGLTDRAARKVSSMFDAEKNAVELGKLFLEYGGPK